jgi:hypothetical protein
MSITQGSAETNWPRALIAASAFLFAMGCAAPDSAPAPEAPLGANVLSEAEASEGWVLLFDGVSTEGWRNFNGEGLNPQWQVEDGALTLTGGGGGDIVTLEQFENFELQLEWRISEGGNSGLMFNVVEGRDGPEPWRTGPEMQILDNERHSDRHDPTHRAGANYDLHAPATDSTRPVGEFNQVRLVVNSGHVQQWLNGELIVEYDLWSPEWDAIVANSKFASMADYARSHSGHIAVQDHGDRVWFRNIKIRRL